MEPMLVRDLDAVRRRRAELRESIALLEAALSAPPDRPDVWGEQVQLGVNRLATDFRDHLDVTEGAGGLHETIIESSPRLVHAVEVLGAEHREIDSAISGLGAATEAPVMAADVEAVTQRAARLLDLLAKHRQRGADLVYEAFEQDLGAGD